MVVDLVSSAHPRHEMDELLVRRRVTHKKKRSQVL